MLFFFGIWILHGWWMMYVDDVDICTSFHLHCHIESLVHWWLHHFRFRPLEACHQEVFCKKSVLGNFAKFTGKKLCQSLFSNKVAGLSFLRTPFLQNTSPGDCFWLVASPLEVSPSDPSLVSMIFIQGEKGEGKEKTWTPHFSEHPY